MKILIHLAMVVSLGSVAGAQREPAEQSPSSQAVLSKPCCSIALNGELSAGERFEKRVNKCFVFRLDPHFIGPDGNISSWEISLVRADDKNRDYIYPVNPPLRFNGLQILGPSYGADTKSSLSHPHEMHFLLSDNDYDCLWPLVTNALWPFKAPDPDKPADQYVNALESLSTGELKLIVVSYLADQATGSIQHISFRVEFIAPESFVFDSALSPKALKCSHDKSPTRSMQPKPRTSAMKWAAM